MKKLICAAIVVLLLCSCSSTSWMTKPYSLYSQDKYVCGVGYGATQAEADQAARKELASLFGMNVQAVTSRVLTDASVDKNGVKEESYSDIFVSSTDISVNMDNLYGVEIAKRSVTKDGRYVSLAVLNRKANIDYYSANISSVKKTLESQKTAAKSGLGALATVQKAAEFVVSCNDYNTQVVMYNYLSGANEEFVSLSEGYDLYSNAVNSVVLEVSVEGDVNGIVKTAMSEIFTKAGFTVSNGTQTPTARASVTISWTETPGTGVASSFTFANYNADVSLVDLAKNETVMVYSSKGKEGHQDVTNAKARCMNGFVKQLQEEFVPAVNERYTY